MYIPKFFTIQELVPKPVFDTYGEQAFQFFDDRALITLDQLRSKFGKAIVNDWHWLGKFDSRGFRLPFDSDGAFLSAHKRGQAFDVTFVDKSASYVREYVLKHPDEFPYINAIEADVNWFHFDTRNCERILVFKS